MASKPKHVAEPMLDIMDVAETCRVSEKTVRRWIKAGDLPAARRVSDLLCMSNLAHASKLKEHDNDDDFQGSFRRAA
jgi:predicted site-specific integrase-resolvase